MKLLSPLSLAALTLLLLPAFATAQEPPKSSALPAGIERVTSVEGITEYALPNGLHVLLFSDPSRPIVTVNITYKVGSRHEDYGETGMAHLLEHMVFKGTPKRPNIPQELTEHGARANGTTWLDRTNYYETVAATEENLRWALEMEADRMVNSNIARADLEKEFSVVRNEYERGENNPFSVLQKRMLPVIFNWHNYGHSTIGEKSDIEGAPIERLQAFYKKYYQPDNAVLVVAGKFDELKTLNLIKGAFGPIPKPARGLPRTYTREPQQDGERQVTLRRTGDVQVVSCMFRSAPGSHPDNSALDVLGLLLIDEPAGKLYQALVETKKAARVSHSVQGFAEAGTIGFTAEVRQEQSLPAAQAAMLQVLDSLTKEPPTEAEVTRARTRLLKGFEMSLKRSDSLGLRLSESIATGDWRLAFYERDELEKVSVADVTRVAATYFKPSNRTIGLFIPETNADRAAIPEAPDLTAMLKDYKGHAPIAQGEDFEASPSNIEKRTTRGATEQGLKYAFLPKKTRGESVNATLTLRFGNLETLQGKAVIAEYTASMLNKGTRQKTHQQIKDLLDRLKARVSIGGGHSSVTASLETDREHLPEVLRLVREMLREPSFPADEFEKMKQEALAALEQQRTDPQALAGILFARLSRPYYTATDPRYTRTVEEEIAATKALTVAQLQEFHRAFYGANHGTAAIVGDFDQKTVEPLLREAFADWISPAPYQRLGEDYRDVSARAETILTPEKANAVYVAGFGFPMRDDDPDYPAVSLGGYMLGGGFLNSRLATRIRQKEGISYGVRGGFGASSLDKSASFNASMIYNPQNVARLETAFREEIERAAKAGFTPEELDAARSGWLKAREVSRASDGSLAGMLAEYLYVGRDFTFDASREELVKKLTAEQVSAVVKKYLDYSRMISVKAGDFSKAAKP
jgi:zinc protease